MSTIHIQRMDDVYGHLNATPDNIYKCEKAKSHVREKCILKIWKSSELFNFSSVFTAVKSRSVIKLFLGQSDPRQKCSLCDVFEKDTLEHNLMFSNLLNNALLYIIHYTHTDLNVSYAVADFWRSLSFKVIVCVWLKVMRCQSKHGRSWGGRPSDSI